MNELHLPPYPFAGVWEEILALLQAYPEWKSTQILQESAHLAPERAVSAPMETLMHDLGIVRPPGRSTWEGCWPPERIQGEPLQALPTEPHLSEEAVSDADQCAAQAHPLPAPVPGTPSSATREHEASHPVITIEQAIAAYLQEMRASRREPKTLQWHQTSLGALRRYLWRRFHRWGGKRREIQLTGRISHDVMRPLFSSRFVVSR